MRRLPDGRTIHMACMGQGGPVQPAVAAKARACAWDRAGRGLSAGVARPQAVIDAIDEAADAVCAAGPAEAANGESSAPRPGA